MSGGLPKKEMRRQRRTRSSDGSKGFTEVPSPKRGVQKRFHTGNEERKNVVEIGLKTTNKGKFCEAVVRQLREKALDSNIKPRDSSNIQPFGCVAQETEKEEVIKDECTKTTNARVGINSTSSRDQKLAAVKDAEQYASNLLNGVRSSWQKWKESAQELLA